MSEVVYIVDNGMSYSDHCLIFYRIPQEYAHLDAEWRLVLPWLHAAPDSFLVARAEDVEWVRDPEEGYGNWTLQDYIKSYWPSSRGMGKGAMGYSRPKVVETGKYPDGRKWEKTEGYEFVPAPDEVLKAQTRLRDALPGEWFA